jgi:hypothetical protein
VVDALRIDVVGDVVTLAVGDVVTLAVGDVVTLAVVTCRG